MIFQKLPLVIYCYVLLVASVGMFVALFQCLYNEKKELVKTNEPLLVYVDRESNQVLSREEALNSTCQHINIRHLEAGARHKFKIHKGEVCVELHN